MNISRCENKKNISSQLEKTLLDTMVSGAIDSSVIRIPKTTIVAYKNFTGNLKQLKFGAKMDEPVSKHVGIKY